MLLLDYFSKWIEVEKVSSKMMNDVNVALENVITRFGIPETIVCDNNPFNSFEFKSFVKQWDIERSFTSLYHSQRNGMVEKAVGTKEMLFKKAKEKK